MGSLIDFNLEGKTVSEKFYSIEADAGKLRKLFSSLRYGQAVYLVAEGRFPEVKALPDAVDCFYVDDLTEKFLAELKTSLGLD